MNTIKYPIKEVEIEKIPSNRMLSVGITETQRVLCEKSIRQYGLLTPIVLVENPSGELMTLTGEKELEVLKGMNVTKADVFVTKLKKRSDTGKVILLLSSFQKGLNPLSEGMILRELLKAGEYTQKELAETLMKSKAWVCKRLSLAGKLNENVAEMILSKQLCPTGAQDIARLPGEVQHKFAMEVYSKGIPKSTIERLVAAYNSKKTPEALKQEIINNPDLASHALTTVKFGKCPRKSTSDDMSSRFDSSLRLLLKLVLELEMGISGMSEDEVGKYHRVLPAVCTSMGRFARLLEYYCVSPGKPPAVSNNAGGIADGNR